ncbi:MAG TPA: beta-ketoacyl-[acyl-carrier-protein] synthase family protein, partial [Candidatus Dormibacteraeota bacterium]|nr:beta-ketoacyl-[acyl-carrier-protein] synthase family protein [Candidatus Dormibacteraeota bacterium]
RYDLRDPDRPNQLALYSVGRALEDAGLPTDGAQQIDADIVFGTGHGNVGLTNEQTRTFYSEGYRKLRPTTVVRGMFNRPANIASIRFQLIGTSYVVSCACATGTIAFGQAYHRIRWGETDMAVAACADSGLDLATFAAWNRLGVLTRHPDPATASRPFDKTRDGLVMGEGAAGFFLETLESAQRRGARIWAEVVGYGSTCDAKHIVQPDSAGQVRAVRKALASAGLNPADIDYVNAHGTSTELADIAEATTLREVFGNHADRVPVSNTKAQLGHLMGATAGVELVTTLCALQHNLIPPNRNLDEIDPRCPLQLVRNEPLKTPLRHALKNSFAFGGTNCAVILKKYP